MGWIRDLLPTIGSTIEDVQPQQEERFPFHTYGPGYPIAVTRDELDDLAYLFEVESKAPDSWDNSPLLSREDIEETLEDVVGDIGGGLPSPEEQREEFGEILELWQEQLSGSKDAVWATEGTDYHLEFYIRHCERRADLEHDDFEEPDELETAREIHARIQATQNDDSKLAVVHRRDLPLDEPKEESAESS
ncbi:hypothetical protein CHINAEXTREME_17125 [Halobiforma lacisalsi AJ5]|uniref:Uncharacterized protein n=1 Tax=Natronobacterium lacisalsi AJ5 TaxID=358396 RepID=M0LRW6_NATLA|nr:hypothetical protein [Halobiforma lacisalsi]APW99386.1 hypothetical protein CHINAEXTREME_17125 [Halobiforma lacisalsi AJ5]EMA35179.1 hypothetical protein C445_05653 [Halobiforma lacisalsi AJ5]